MTVRRPVFAVSFAAAGLIASTALADGRTVPPIRDPLVAKECGACHMPYPAGLLPAASWAGIVDGLGNHFGENASLDATAAAQIKTYLTTNAAAGWRESLRNLRSGTVVSDASLRITAQPWFQRKHARRAAPENLQRRGAKSIGDCAACHRGAVQGNY